MVCTLEPWQDLVFTDSTFGPDTACFQNNMSFQSTVIGCETWIITKDMAAKLSAFATSCCRIMLNIKCLHKVSNHRVYDLNGISQLSYCHTCQLSRFSRESPSFSSNLPVSQLEHQISRIKWTFKHFCAIVWNLVHFFTKFELFLFIVQFLGHFCTCLVNDKD